MVPVSCGRHAVVFEPMIEVDRTRRVTVAVGAVARFMVAGCGAIAAGSAVGLGIWRYCYHQSDIIRFWGQIVIVALVIAAIMALVVVRPNGLAAFGLAVVIAAAAAFVYWWLVGNTSATRCAWYRESTPPPAGTDTTGPPTFSIVDPTTTGLSTDRGSTATTIPARSATTQP